MLSQSKIVEPYNSTYKLPHTVVLLHYRSPVSTHSMPCMKGAGVAGSNELLTQQGLRSRLRLLCEVSHSPLLSSRLPHPAVFRQTKDTTFPYCLPSGNYPYWHSTKHDSHHLVGKSWHFRKLDHHHTCAQHYTYAPISQLCLPSGGGFQGNNACRTAASFGWNGTSILKIGMKRTAQI